MDARPPLRRGPAPTCRKHGSGRGNEAAETERRRRNHHPPDVTGLLATAAPALPGFRGPDVLKGAIEHYRQALKGHGRSTLQRAWAKVRREHQYSTWLTPAALVQAGRKAGQQRFGAVSTRRPGR